MVRKVVLALTPLQSLGDILRRRREDIGVSLEELQERTKIRIRYLEALEAGDWDVLPGDVYARGFVRRYAESVNLDGFDLLRAYVDLPQENLMQVSESGKAELDQTPGEATHKSEPTTTVRDSAAPDTRPAVQVATPVVEPEQGRSGNEAVDGSGRGDWRERSATANRPPRKTTVVRRSASRGFGGQAAVVVGVLIVLGGGLLLLHNSRHPAKQPAGGAPATNVANNQPNTSAATNNSTSRSNATNPSNAITGNTVNPGTNQTASSPPGNTVNSTTPGSGTGSAVQVTAQPFQSSNPPTQTYLVTTTSPLSVTLSVAGSACWVSVTADGAVVDSSQMLQPGTSTTWTGKQSVNIYVGHPPSVSVTVNGQSVTLPPQTNPYHLVFEKSGG
ncbi:helix-turn-helix domain-containing protein [Alicyclobacillus sp. ALC3]|uniref:helix-turn-helix domain-containing protein n=1 Tax=Alicyclobacillus sp. ALC3 TaxID=2796143 RepID=UPI002377E294|nr:RodZ domain-containing protein [Alicyclobacillus sp. ALC3]WDL97323.1 helix-turn-helix domain-containing protein [Alicyclobacillus sp. ALC3]